MVSKRFLFIVVAFATILVTSEIAAAKELTSKNESEVKDAKHDNGYNNDYGHGGYDNGNGGYDNGHGGYDNGHGGYDNGHGGYDNGYGGYYNGDHHHHHRHHGRYCKYGCCGYGYGGYYNGGCRCCDTLAEATAYKQAHQAQTHN